MTESGCPFRMLLIILPTYSGTTDIELPPRQREPFPVSYTKER